MKDTVLLVATVATVVLATATGLYLKKKLNYRTVPYTTVSVRFKKVTMNHYSRYSSK